MKRFVLPSLLLLCLAGNICIAKNTETGKPGAINKKYEIIQMPDNNAYSEGLGSVLGENGKYGFVDRNGRIIIPPKYDRSSFFHDGISIVYVNGRYGFINTKGNYVVEPKYQETGTFSEGLIPVLPAPKYNVYDVNGKKLYEFPNLSIHQLIKDCAVVRINENFALADLSGNLLTAPDYRYIGKFQGDKYFVFKKNSENKLGLMDKSGKQILAPKYTCINVLKDGTILTKRETSYSLYSNEGKKIKKLNKLKYEKLLTNTYKETVSTNNIYETFEKNGKWGIKDIYGKVTTEAVYNKRPIVNEYVYVDTSNPWEYLDENFNTVTIVKDYNIDKALSFSEGLAAFSKNRLQGYIDKTGKTVIPAKFLYASEFNDGLAVVYVGTQSDKKAGVIDKTGKYTIPPSFYYIGEFRHGTAQALKNRDDEDYIFIDSRGNIIPPI